MVIISIVSCRVQETVRLFLAVPGTACPAARRPRGTEPAARLRRERVLDSEDRPRFMRLAMDEPRP
jgi:hypothetical protein